VQDGVSLSRTRVTKTFTGDIQGTSTAELLMAQAPEESAAYVGMERIVGTVNGRAGSFVLHHSATADRGAQSTSWTVVPDSGTGELRGIRARPALTSHPTAVTPSPSTTTCQNRFANACGMTTS
jgi:hypothetical protein